jgi:aminoglycoside phosphotransferase (APT) family kinase protein
LPENLLQSKRLENYLRLTSLYSDFSLVPKSATKVNVSKITKLSGGLTNNTYSFLLTFVNGKSEQSFDLILKSYTENVGLWFKTSRPGEDARPYVREFQVLKGLARVGFPVPIVYLCECDSFFLGHPFVIMRQEKVIQERVSKLDCFAATLARLHNLKVKELGIKSLGYPRDNIAFARERQICLKQYLIENRHYRELKKDFNYAINWLESNTAENKCPQYCLLHGEYHPGHALTTNANTLKVIDWESVQIGDPAFDVGYAYHMIKLMYDNDKNSRYGNGLAERFVSEYSRNFKGDIAKRLEFYKVVGLLGVAIVVSSWISSPIDAYKSFGKKALARSLLYPIPHAYHLFKRWLDNDFLVDFLKYSVQYIDSTLR